MSERRPSIARADSPEPFAAVRHEESEPMAAPEPRDRMATNPEGRRTAEGTGQWAPVPRAPDDVARTAAWAARHVERLESGPFGIGRPPVPATKDEGAGLWKFCADGFAELGEAMRAQGEKLDQLVERDHAADVVRERRGKTVAEVVLSVVKAVAVAAVFAFVGFLIAHFRW